MSRLPQDGNGTPIQSFGPSQLFANSALTGNVTFGPADTYDINTSGLKCLKVEPVEDSSYFYASNTSAVYPIAAGSVAYIWLLNSNTESGTVQFGTAATANALMGM